MNNKTIIHKKEIVARMKQTALPDGIVEYINTNLLEAVAHGKRHADIKLTEPLTSAQEYVLKSQLEQAGYNPTLVHANNSVAQICFIW